MSDARARFSDIRTRQEFRLPSAERPRPNEIRGELSDAAWRLAHEIPVFGKFIAIFRDLDQIFRRGPQDAAALSDQILERAALLIKQFRVELEPRLTALEGQVSAALDALKVLAEDGVAGPTVAYIAYLALLNDSILEDKYSPDAEFTAWYLNAADLRFLIHEYDHILPWEEVRPTDPRLPWPTPYEAGYSLTRLRDFGFLLSEPVIMREPLAKRVFMPNIATLDDFVDHMGLVRPVYVLPCTEDTVVMEALRGSSRAEFLQQLKGLLAGEHMPVGVVRRHLLDNFQWAVIKAGTERGAFTGAFLKVADAQKAAEAELYPQGLERSNTWISAAA
jgi:hypothetical protein